MEELELVRRTKTMVENLKTGSTEGMPYCKRTTKWQLNGYGDKMCDRMMLEEKLKEHFSGRKIVPGYFTAGRLGKGDYLVTGNFYVEETSELSAVHPHRYEYHAVIAFSDMLADRIMLFGNQHEEIFRIVRCDEEHYYMLRRSEIRYVESYQNDCIWHCISYDARERLTLKNANQLLSDSFHHINKSIIINIDHISELDQDVAILDNQEKLYISRRTLPKVKKKLREYIGKQKDSGKTTKESAIITS